MYECSECAFSGRRESCEKHFLIRHVKAELVPWTCSLCGFRSKTEQNLDKHMDFEIHKRALALKPDESTVFLKSHHPYKIEIGRDIFISREDRPNYASPRSGTFFHSSNTNKKRVRSKVKMQCSEWHDSLLSPKRKRYRYVESLNDCTNQNIHAEMGTIVKEDKSNSAFAINNNDEVHSTTDIDSEVEGEDTSSFGYFGYTTAPSDDRLIDEVSGNSRLSSPMTSNGYCEGVINPSYETESFLAETIFGLKSNLNDSHHSDYVQSCIPTAGQTSPENFYTQNNFTVRHNHSNDFKVTDNEDQNGHLDEEEANFEASSDRAGGSCEDEDETSDKEVLEDKVSELIQALEPLRNISKALIAIDHHFRRMIPIMKAFVPLIVQQASGRPADPSTGSSGLSTVSSEQSSRTTDLTGPNSFTCDPPELGLSARCHGSSAGFSSRLVGGSRFPGHSTNQGSWLNTDPRLKY